MKAMVLCAGLGTRLRPLTTVWPKPAIPLLGGPLFRYSLATLNRAGITQVAINTHHLPEVMTSIARAEAGDSLVVAHEPGEIQGTGGGIRGLRSFLGDDDFVVLNGDVLFSIDLQPVIAAHRASGAAATMVLLPMPEGATYNGVEIDADTHVRRIAGLGPGGSKLSNWHFTGAYVMTPKVFDFMAPTGALDILRDVFLPMIEKGLTVHGHVLQQPGAHWSDLGTPQTYLQTHQSLLFSQIPVQAFGEHGPFAGTTLDPATKVWQHESAQIDADVKSAGPAYFDEGSVVEAGARFGAAVSLGRNAKVSKNARLNRVAVLENAVVPEGVHWQDCIVGPGGLIVSGL